MSPTLKERRDSVVASLTAAAVKADGAARHLNLYRAASYRIAADCKEGREHFGRTRNANNVLGEFDTYDQDKDRPDWARKLQLSNCDDMTAQQVNSLLGLAQKKDTNNLALLHQIARTRRIVLGNKDVNESLAYARRASLRLHPDLNGDLNGWSIPGVAYAKDLPPTYRYEHAKHGAAALFSIHNNMKVLLNNPHYQRLLYSKTVMRGGTLTVPQLASDLSVATLAGIAICLVKKKSLALLLKTSAIAYAVLLLVYGGQAVVRYRAKQREVKCRELIKYQPTNL